MQNILKKQKNHKLPKNLNKKLFDTEEESNLALMLKEKTKEAQSLYLDANYEAILKELSTLKQPVDLFFEKVMIMDEDERKRGNRLLMLHMLKELFTKVADISLLTPV